MHHLDANEIHEEKTGSNNTRMLCAVLNKSWKYHPTKQQLYDHLSPISQTIQVRWRHAGHCKRIKDEFISLTLLWTPIQGCTSVGRPTRTVIHQLCVDRRCLWCNGYCRRKWTQQHEFKSWTRQIAFHIVLIPLGKVWIQLFSF